MVPQEVTYLKELEGRPDPDADVHEQTVVHLRAVRVRKELAQLPALEQWILCRLFGIAGSPVLSRREIASRLGRSLAETRQLEEMALAHLRSRPELIAEAA